MSQFISHSERLRHAVENREMYRYSGTALENKSLVALIAPTAVGKTTLARHMINACTAIGVESAEVGTLTTRAHREDDPQNYRTDIPFDEMLDLIERQKLVNWSLMPTGHIYATEPDSFPAEFNFLPLLPDSLPMLRRAGFQALHALYLTASVEQWREQLGVRQNDPSFGLRLEEARESLQYASTYRNELSIINNQRGSEHLQTLATRLVTCFVDNVPIDSEPQAVDQLDQMLTYVTATHS